MPKKIRFRLVDYDGRFEANPVVSLDITMREFIGSMGKKFNLPSEGRIENKQYAFRYYQPKNMRTKQILRGSDNDPKKGLDKTFAQLDVKDGDVIVVSEVIIDFSDEKEQEIDHERYVTSVGSEISKDEDIRLLERFRFYVDRYLELGYAPVEDLHSKSYDSKGRTSMKRLLEQKEFKEYRKYINEMKSKVHEILGDCGVQNTLTDYDLIFMKKRTFRLVDLITKNCSSIYLNKLFFLDKIDETVGILKMESPETWWLESEKEIHEYEEPEPGSSKKLHKSSSLKSLILLFILLSVFYIPYFLLIYPDHEIWAVGILPVIITIATLFHSRSASSQNIR